VTIPENLPPTIANPYIKQVSEYAGKLLREELADGMLYHNFGHTAEVVEASQIIGRNSGLNDEELEILCIAAWMHDIGYTRIYAGHEEEGAHMATEFLHGIAYPEEKIQQVTSAIMATKVPQNPRNLIEDALCDADLIHLAGKDFFERGQVLRMEWERVCQTLFSDFDWLRFNLEFMDRHSYHTTYVQNRYTEQLEKNRKKLRKRIRKALEESPPAAAAVPTDNGTVKHPKGEKMVEKSEKPEKVEKAEKKEKSSRPERGIETMFRVTSRNHIDLSSIADQKANIMITTNALVISLVVSLLGRAMDENTFLLIPTLLLLAVCVTTIIFATLSTRPTITSGTFTAEDIRQRKVNLLFFGNFYNMTLEDYEQGLQEMMNDRDYLYGSMTKDIYFLGKVLGRKYRYLRICYSIFMYGLIISVLAFGIAFITAS
jgi:predicted metal-dependent HD superfamily phosphohydrolase